MIVRGPTLFGAGVPRQGLSCDSIPFTTRPTLSSSEMEAAGHAAIARIRSFGAAGDGAAAYYDTVDAVGFLVEAVEPPSAMPPTDFAL